jgi:FtsP/CotA-like multicopper oxidase with cupredoxin domain
LHYVHFEVVSRRLINFDTQAVNRICGERGAVNGICLQRKETTQHDGTKGSGFKAIIPTNNELAFGSSVTTGPEFVAENNAQYKDTVTALPGQVTRIRARFDRRGRFVWHCHFLSHEDHEMMRIFQVY